MSPPKKKIKLSENTEDICKYDFSTLPYNVLILIFKKLDFKTITHCAVLCGTFYNVSNEPLIYSKVTFKYNMDRNLFENYVSKITCPKHLSVEYKFFDNESEMEDYTEFDQYVMTFIKKSGDSLLSLSVDSCRNDNILSLLSETPKLTDVTFLRCKGSFRALPTLKNLTRIHMASCMIPNKILLDTLQTSSQLKKISLSDNCNLNVNDICQTMAKYNNLVEEVRFSEKKKVQASGLKALARCCKLRVLELISEPFQCDLEDSLQQLAAGCPLLERLTLYGWKGVNDDNLIPVLHSCIQLKELDLRGIDITIKSCREAALSLPFLRTLDVYKCNRIKKTQIAKLQNDFQEIRIIK